MSEINIEPGRVYRSINGREWTKQDPQTANLAEFGWIEMVTSCGMRGLFRQNGYWVDGNPDNDWTLVEDVTHRWPESTGGQP